MKTPRHRSTRLLLLLTASLGAGACGPGVRRIDTAPSEIHTGPGGERAFRDSTLDESGPIPVLVLRGTPYEQGFAYGVLLRDELAEFYARVGEMETGAFSKLSGLKRRIAARRFARHARRFEDRTPEGHRAEMRGLADGAGLPYDDVLAVSSGSLMLMACTSVLAIGTDGGLLHGRNFDFRPTFLGEHPILVRHETDAGVPSWSFSVVGYLPSFNGFNDEGISVSLNASGMNAAQPHGPPMGWTVRDVLSKASTLDEVRAVVRGAPNDDLDWVLTVGSAREKSGLVFDLGGDAQAETRLHGDEPLVVLNRPFGDGRHERDGLAKARLDPVLENDPFNVRRWDAAERFLASNDLDTEESMWRFLRDRTGAAESAFFTEGTIANQGTLFSAVFDLGDGRVSVATGSSWAPLREVWSFDARSRKLSPLIPADPVTESPAFRAQEKNFLGLERARIAGELDLAMMTAELEPLMLSVYGVDLDDLSHPDPRFTALLAKAAEASPDLPSLSLALGYLLKDTQPDRAIAALERAWKSPRLEPLRKLYALKHLANTHASIGHRAEAARFANLWLERERAMTAGRDAKNDYLEETKARMEDLAREAP